MNKYLIIALLLTLMTATDSEAQQRRRFFQNLFGSKDTSQNQRTPTQNSQSKTDQKSSSKSAATREPNFKRDYKTPTLATPNQRSILSTPSRSSSKNYPPKSSYSYKSKTKAKSIGSKNKGFGFTVALNDDDKVYVSSVDRYGNAAKEGLQRGDYLLEIGGIEATSVEEFDEIAKIMNDGDQMEFKIGRSGREKSFEIMFGDLPEVEDTPIEKSKVSENRRYDFAPPTQTGSGGSVLNNRRNNNTAVREIFSDQSESRRIQALNQTIQSQNRQIQILQQQIQQLQRQRRSR